MKGQGTVAQKASVEECNADESYDLVYFWAGDYLHGLLRRPCNDQLNWITQRSPCGAPHRNI